ncbi:MAG: pyruvate kinase [Candidatus Pacebacteria bacterium CG10_big_fil_rev_8_21_14_0_10_36_11]|nr:pyruvate kinase [Candidatus Pacearchaeota archaeon]OIP74152.1 MAG: pyruvate kinase [Candidatus Pacebacteria bacterium CG2_30_36_39]PIR65055.1 MAG: pyruvate kinase [Candidatus Pacebacteria bacterium CG10_big_fil_rev_8_21_14_0_10_36_11]PJC42723.1 MAG: pyruvate kinase [Candidatus Pacebacteria bacterium CG_4_9_14_0_2_um_filter_36_8]
MQKMLKRTKIVATIGPATETEEVIGQLIDAGMNVARFNTKHGTPEWHRERVQRVRKVAAEKGLPVAVLLDLQGPEIRVDLRDGQAFSVRDGEEVFFTFNKQSTEEKVIFIPENVVDTLQIGNFVLLDDGACEFEIVKKEDDFLMAKALGDFEVKTRKTMNTPGIVIDMPSLIDPDRVQLDGAVETGVDFVGLSFVRDKEDIKILRDELDKRGLKDTSIVAKIENQSALDNLDEIINASDAVMVARGDLAVEVPFEQLAFWQKLIITKCRLAGKPVITATQMLKSMVESPRPTRAEVSDVANAVYDSTDAVMLSEETTIGKFPVKAVETQAKIAAFNEEYETSYLDEWEDETDPSLVAHAAVYLMQNEENSIDSVVCLTETGNTVNLLTRFRPKVDVHALTSNELTYRKLALNYGVIPHIVEFAGGKIEEPNAMVEILKEKGIVKSGETVLVIYGTIWKTPGLTNSLSIVHVK